MGAYLLDLVRANNAKVIIGTDVTCDDTADEQMWEWALELIKLLGPKHVLGVAIGRDMDRDYKHNHDTVCHDTLWQHRYWDTLVRRVSALDGVSKDIKVTIIWGMNVLDVSRSPQGNIWKEDGQALVQPLVENAYKLLRDRWVWSFNVEPLWNKTFYPTSPEDCEQKIADAVSIGAVQDALAEARQRITMTTNNESSSMWLIGGGWSSSLPDNHENFSFCKDFASITSFRTAYQGFLNWDMSLPYGLVGPELAFSFTVHDSEDRWGTSEFLGLMENCGEPECKIRHPMFSI